MWYRFGACLEEAKLHLHPDPLRKPGIFLCDWHAAIAVIHGYGAHCFRSLRQLNSTSDPVVIRRMNAARLELGPLRPLDIGQVYFWCPLVHWHTFFSCRTNLAEGISISPISLFPIGDIWDEPISNGVLLEIPNSDPFFAQF